MGLKSSCLLFCFVRPSANRVTHRVCLPSQVKSFSLIPTEVVILIFILSVPPLSLCCSPPGSPTTVGFFPSPSSLTTPAGLVRMPGVAYSGSGGVKDVINAVQAYQVR